ncbi:hypothetical protein XENORESO_008242 [Xenotaenia resolanae]|uniref:Uncharacterized protein n=1 Tax=Xenotaenia resolanae TaxID=208358 RepID=A0ABV0WTG7_9TELE
MVHILSVIAVFTNAPRSLNVACDWTKAFTFKAMVARKELASRELINTDGLLPSTYFILSSASPVIDEKTLITAMTGLSRQMTQFSTESKASCSEELQRKRRQNNPKIVEAVHRLHNSNLNFSRYDPRQRLCSPHNAGSHLRWPGSSPELHGVDYASIVSGCKTHYGMVRRNFLYSQPDHAEKAAAIKTSARCWSRRKRLLEARLTGLEAEELAFWNGVTIDLMSDEEDGSFEGRLVGFCGPQVSAARSLLTSV